LWDNIRANAGSGKEPTQAMLDAEDKINKMAMGGSINIDPSKKGTFTAAATKHNMGVQEFANKVLSAEEGTYSPEMRMKANFAKNASKWNHENGGYLPKYVGGGGLPPEALKDIGDIYNPTTSYPSIYYRNEGNNWYTFDTKGKKTWEPVATGHSALSTLNSWKGKQDKMYMQSNPEFGNYVNDVVLDPYKLPIKSPVSGLIPNINVATGEKINEPVIPTNTRLATKQAYGLNNANVTDVQPNERLLGADYMNGKLGPIIGERFPINTTLLPLAKKPDYAKSANIQKIIDQELNPKVVDANGNPIPGTEGDKTKTNTGKEKMPLTMGDKLQMASNFISPAFNLISSMQGYDKEPEMGNKYEREALNRLENLRIRPDYNPIIAQANATREAINEGSSGVQRLASLLGVNNQVANVLASNTTQVANQNVALDQQLSQAQLMQGERDRMEKIRAKGITDANQAAQFGFLSKAFEQLGPAVGTIGSGTNNRAEMMTMYNMMKNIYPDFSLVPFNEFVDMMGASNFKYTGGVKNLTSGNVSAFGAGSPTTTTTTNPSNFAGSTNYGK
jgi:hypothetical protein